MCIPPLSVVFASGVVLGEGVDYENMVIIRWVNRDYVLDRYRDGYGHALYVFKPSTATEFTSYPESSREYKALMPVLDLMEPRLLSFERDPEKVREYLITREEYDVILEPRSSDV